MPVYVYEEILENGEGGELFEVTQSMQEDPLEVHPLSGRPVRRVYQPPNVVSRYSERAVNKSLDPKRVEQAGFTRYEKDKGTGTYHKTAGKTGPDTLKP